MSSTRNVTRMLYQIAQKRIFVTAIIFC